jgi:hypothetical protein
LWRVVHARGSGELIWIDVFIQRACNPLNIINKEAKYVEPSKPLEIEGLRFQT